ncbi:MAG: J domain-containing protein [Polyangiaceae bacterium]|nr:J domain-containing protein [Polyangiaceae bacterium]
MTLGDPNLVRLFSWRALLDDADYYDLLGVSSSADPPTIKAAFHEFALAFHPDGHLDHGPEALAAAQEVFQRGAEAYRVLSSEDLRSRYNLLLAKGQRRLDTPSAAPPTSTQAAVKSLDDLCRSAAAKLCAQRADELISHGNLRDARKELKMALYHDGSDNRELEERLEALDIALYAMGD